MVPKPLCVIVDDEWDSIGLLSQCIDDLGLLAIEKTYTDPDLFLTEVDQLKSDIIFLDMDMSIEGHEVASKLVNKKVIFVSGHPETAIRAYDVEAIDFVQKPPKQHRLKKAIKKALETTSPQKVDRFSVRTEDAHKHEIIVSNIVYITPDKVDPRDKTIHLAGAEGVIKAKNINFNDLLELCSPSSLMQISKNSIVNLDYVRKLKTKDSIEIDYNGESRELTIGEAYKEPFLIAKPIFR
jgi:two-component system LytT family response regulator